MHKTEHKINSFVLLTCCFQYSNGKAKIARLLGEIFIGIGG